MQGIHEVVQQFRAPYLTMDTELTDELFQFFGVSVSVGINSTPGCFYLHGSKETMSMAYAFLNEMNAKVVADRKNRRSSV